MRIDPIPASPPQRERSSTHALDVLFVFFIVNLTNCVRAPKKGRATQRLATMAANREVREACARAAPITNAAMATAANHIMTPSDPAVPKAL
jgi:hypothetical protein